MLDYFELKNQIIINTNNHLNESRSESATLFQTLDENGDGKKIFPVIEYNF